MTMECFFRFCSFVFNADFGTKHIKFLINKGFANFCNKSVEQILSLYFCVYNAGFGQVIVCLK